MDSKYANPDKDPNGKWQNTSANAPNAFTHQGMVYAIQNPFTGELLYPPIGRCWTFQQRDMLNYLQGWCNYELRDINDAEKRAEVCGTSKELVRVGVKAIMIKDSFEISQSKAMEVYNRGQWPKLFLPKVDKVDFDVRHICKSRRKSSYKLLENGRSGPH